MKKYPNFNREIKAIRLTNKFLQDVLDISTAKMYVNLEVSNVYRIAGGNMSGNVVIAGKRRRVIKPNAQSFWTLTVVSKY